VRKKRELRQTRTDLVKYQKERVMRSKDLAETRHTLIRRTKEIGELRSENDDLKNFLTSKRTALKEKVKEAQRL